MTLRIIARHRPEKEAAKRLGDCGVGQHGIINGKVMANASADNKQMPNGVIIGDGTHGVEDNPQCVGDASSGQQRYAGRR